MSPPIGTCWPPAAIPNDTFPTDRWRTDLALGPRALEPYRSRSTLGGFITDFEYDWRRHKVPPKQVAQADPLQFMLLDAADQAMQDAGYDERPFDRRRSAWWSAPSSAATSPFNSNSDSVFPNCSAT